MQRIPNRCCRHGKIAIISRPGTLALAALLVLVAGCGGEQDAAALLERGRALAEEGNVPAAIIEFKNAVQASPEDAQARFELGQAYLRVRNAPAALKELTRARTLGMSSDVLNQGITEAMISSGATESAATELALYSNDKDAGWLSLQGRLDMAVGRYDEAATVLERAIRLDPENLEARRAAARAAIALGRPEQARIEIEEALRLTEADFELWVLRGDLDAHDGNADAAIAAYTKALEIVPKSPLALLQRANARAAATDFEGALADLDQIGEAGQDDPRALYLRARIAEAQGFSNNALRHLRRILNVLPDHRQSLSHAAAIHLAANEYSQAEGYVQRLLTLDPANEDYRRMLRSVRLAAGKLDTGLGDAAKIDIEQLADPSVLALLGTAYMKHGNIGEASRSLERARELAPDSAPIRAQLAFAQIQSGNTEEGMKELARIRAENPDFLYAAVLQAFGYASTGDRDNAFAAANDLVERNPDGPVAYNVRGYLHAAFDQAPEAVADFNLALQHDDTFIPARFNLARLALRSGNREEAQAHIRKVLEHVPNEPQALMFMAAITASGGDQAGAVKLWRQARDNNPDAILPRVALARYYRTNADIANAEKMAQEAYDLAPYLPAAQFEYAVVKLYVNDVEAALPVIGALSERLPDSAQVLQLYARAYEKSGDAKGLEATLKKLVEKFPDNVEGHMALARFHLVRGESDLAQAQVRTLRDMGVTSSALYDLEGDLHFASGDFKAALRSYREAHAAEPGPRSVLKIYAAEQREGEPSDILDQWLAQHAGDHDVRLVRATALLALGRQAEAISDYEHIIAAEPDNVVALNNLAWIYDESGDPRGEKFARRAYELAPARAEVADTYGWILVRAGKHEQGRGVLARAIEAAPANPDIRYHFASALAKTGESSQAVMRLSALLEDEKQFPSRRDAEALLKELQP